MTEFGELEKIGKESEEYQMLIDVTKEIKNQKKSSLTNRSGKATQVVIHKHLLDKGLNLTINPETKIREIETKMNLLYLLKARVNNKQSEYSVNDLKIVLKRANRYRKLKMDS